MSSYESPRLESVQPKDESRSWKEDSFAGSWTTGSSGGSTGGASTGGGSTGGGSTGVVTGGGSLGVTIGSVFLVFFGFFGLIASGSGSGSGCRTASTLAIGSASGTKRRKIPC